VVKKEAVLDLVEEDLEVVAVVEDLEEGEVEEDLEVAGAAEVEVEVEEDLVLLV
jgi:hypothetical protein